MTWNGRTAHHPKKANMHENQCKLYPTCNPQGATPSSQCNPIRPIAHQPYSHTLALPNPHKPPPPTYTHPTITGRPTTATYRPLVSHYSAPSRPLCAIIESRTTHYSMLACGSFRLIFLNPCVTCGCRNTVIHTSAYPDQLCINCPYTHQYDNELYTCALLLHKDLHMHTFITTKKSPFCIHENSCIGCAHTFW